MGKVKGYAQGCALLAPSVLQSKNLMALGSQSADLEKCPRDSCKTYSMRNLTVTLPEAVLARLHILAVVKDMSVKRYAGQVLSQAAGVSGSNWQDEHQELLDQVGSRPRIGDWNREDVYVERVK